MQLQNKNRIAYLGALTLLFSYAEMLLPRVIPFFRLGLGNVIILLAFNLSLPSFLILTVLKALASCLMAGTLFSPFFVISLVQSFFSGLLMFALHHLNRLCKNRLISVYGISISGSAFSALIQIILSSLYLGAGTRNLLGPMLIFNTISGIITAFLSLILKIPAEAPLIKITASEISRKSGNIFKNPLFSAIAICAFAVIILSLNNIWFLVSALTISLILQKLCRRKILLLPHISLWIFVVISCLFVPNGRVLFSVWNFSISEGALLLGIEKALKLSAVSALSQCAASLRPSEKSVTGLCLCYYRGLLNCFRKTEGKLLKRLRTTLSQTDLQEFI